MKAITVFTTTFNRGYSLPKLYESLKRQTIKDFIWLVIDDGSTDNTKKLVNNWKNENSIEIVYYYKENGGMHTGHNAAYDIINTELNVCIDSDDYMTDDAIEVILKKWNSTFEKNRYAGILGLDIYGDGKLVSNRKFPESVISGRYSELKGKYNLKGDIKFVYRTEVIKKYPNYPVFEGEKFTPLGYKYLLIDQDYEMLFLNEPLCVVEYMPDGSTRNIIKQYFKSPNGFYYERKIRMKYAYSLKERFFNAIHLVSTAIILKKFNFLKESSNKTLTVLAIPFGITLYFYLRRKL